MEKKRIKKVKKDLAACRRAPLTDNSIQQEQVLRYRLEKLEEQKDLYWKQRAHVNWLKGGDRNTKFYHAHASQRHRISRIRRLQAEDGTWVEEDGLREFIAGQYKELFASHGVSRLHEVIDKVVPRVSDAMNDTLSAEFSEEEVKQALDGIGDLKAPGPDGMPAGFFKKF